MTRLILKLDNGCSIDLLFGIRFLIHLVALWVKQLDVVTLITKEIAVARQSDGAELPWLNLPRQGKDLS